MRSVEELVKYLISKDIRLNAENGGLKYNAPSGVITDELLTEIREHKNELLDFISEQQKDKIKPYKDKEFVPLSFAQNRLWFLDKLEEENFAYNLPFPVKIEGDLKVDALFSSLKYVLNRHSVLRTSFPEKDGIPFQRINEIPEDAFPLLTVPGNSENEKWEWVRNKLAEEAKKSFNLATGPLYNLQLFCIGKNTHVLFMMFHHIILDGWSIDILLKEINECYKAFSSGNEVTLPKLEIQYTDFSIWHNGWMNTLQAKLQMEFWEKELADAPSLLQIPLIKPRPAIQTLNGCSELFEIEDDLLAGLKKLANENNCSLFMVLYAAFTILLYRYSHQEDITIGTTIANRNRTEIEPLIGSFANTIVLRSDLSGNPAFKDYLNRVKEKLLKVYANQDIPFEKIVEVVKPERSLSHPPLFQILFELQDISNISDLNGLKMTAVEQENTSAKFDMNFQLLFSKGSLLGNLEYNSGLFDIEYIQRMISHYKNLLRNIINNIDCNIDSIDYITTEEKEEINLWNSTKVEFPLDKTFNELFLETAVQYSNRVAAVENDIEITYKELNQRAEMLAAELLEYGAGKEKIVAILCERGIKFLTSIIAVFKCGAAYLPLDPHLPSARLTQMIEQSETFIIISEEKFGLILDEAIAGLDQKNIGKVFIDNLLERKIENITIKKPISTPDDLAYIIFTSGSTGKPKGAMVLQKGMINHLFSKLKDLEITGNDIVAQTASQCFDISVWQYLAALLAGGKVEILLDETAHDAELMLKKVEGNGITILEAVPSFISVMIEIIEAKSGYSFKKLRWLVPTGEALPPELAVKWLTIFPDIPLMNAYGPTECSDDVTHYHIKNISSVNKSSVPIGKPIANTQILILDKNKQIVPVGVTGELYIAGICVGRGYINDEARTKTNFIENPFKTGETIYKSGDLARYLTDGNIEFLGRIDSQVKVRGFRIELSEIEIELHKYGKLKDAVVTVSKDGKELIAYIVPKKAEEYLQDDIKNHLIKILPEYMIPSYFVLMEKLPLTENGKINRGMLPEPNMNSVMEDITLPGTGTEKTIAGIWEELLRIEKIGINQNFFEIGGHSLLATQLVTRLRDKLSIELPLKIIFEKTTIKNLSDYIDTLVWLRDSQNEIESDDFESLTI